MSTSPAILRSVDGPTHEVAVDDAVAVLSALSGLMRTGRAIARRLEEGLGASGTPLAVLKALARSDGHDRPGDLATATGVAPSVVSRVLARLEADGLVVRRRDELDARACHIALTDSGREHLTRVQREAAAMLAPALGAIPTKDLRRLPQLLGQLEQAMVSSSERIAPSRPVTTTSTESN
jgi:DNA-binding MarR family transcriptional regulator